MKQSLSLIQWLEKMGLRKRILFSYSFKELMLHYQNLILFAILLRKSCFTTHIDCNLTVVILIIIYKSNVDHTAWYGSWSNTIHCALRI